MKIFTRIIIAALASSAVLTAAEKPLDFWDEEIRSIATAPADEHIDRNLAALRDSLYFYGRPVKEFRLDHTDKLVGDLSLVYLPAQAQPAPPQKGKNTTAKPIEKVGFLANLWNGKWSLSQDMALKFHLKTTGTNNPAEWQVVLVDLPGKTARATISGTDTKGAWKELSLPLKSFRADEGFDWNSVRLCEFEAMFGADAEVRFDGVRFEDKETYLGVTDKRISQRMAEAEANREFRFDACLRALKPSSQVTPMNAFVLFYLNQDLARANEVLTKELQTEQDPTDYRNLWRTSTLCQLYYHFSNRVGKYPGRMKPEVEKLLLETIWKRTVVQNDIAITRGSPWWIDASENLDLNVKVCNLVSSRIFMDEPDFKDRIYPDYGFGYGYNYPQTSYYGKGIDPATRHGGGRANLKDGKKYNAADHYHAWVGFMKEYYRGLAERGFFLENSANGYSKYTLGFIAMTHQLGGDEELKKISGDFMTLYWADWAQKEISGVHGGPKTRDKGNGGYDHTCQVMLPYLGGSSDGGIGSSFNLFNDYRLPKVVWEMALDRQGMGEFVYRARGIGEEQELNPRPPGTEYTLMLDTDARIVKYNYVTPDYILGTQMDHPNLRHDFLNLTFRVQGMTVAQSPNTVIMPKGYAESGRSLPDGQKGAKNNLVMRNAQHKNVLITQVARTFLMTSPSWFPGWDPYNAGEVVALYTGNDWDEKIDKEGWAFLRKGDAYAAVRPVMVDREDEATHKAARGKSIVAPKDRVIKLSTTSYRWSTDKGFIELEDRLSPVILQAGRKAEHGSFEKFMASILRNPLALHQTIGPYHYLLVYSPFGADKEEIAFNAANVEIPTVDGVPIDYEHPKTFDSPYIQSDYKRGKIKITYGGEELNLDFTKKN